MRTSKIKISSLFCGIRRRTDLVVTGSHPLDVEKIVATAPTAWIGDVGQDWRGVLGRRTSGGLSSLDSYAPVHFTAVGLTCLHVLFFCSRIPRCRNACSPLVPDDTIDWKYPCTDPTNIPPPVKPSRTPQAHPECAQRTACLSAQLWLGYVTSVSFEQHQCLTFFSFSFPPPGDYPSRIHKQVCGGLDLAHFLAFQFAVDLTRRIFLLFSLRWN